MQLVWPLGPITAEAMRIALKRRLKDSTIGTVLRRLEEKGYMWHTVDVRTYVCQATESRGEVTAKAVRRIVNWFCDGSVDEVLVEQNSSLLQRSIKFCDWHCNSNVMV
jgi:BlaI family transcriptional regulator, penicillinase repressor